MNQGTRPFNRGQHQVRNHPLVFFTVLACLFGWSLFIMAALGCDVPLGGMPLGPILAAAIVARAMGSVELHTWGRQLATYRAAPGCYVVAVTVPVAIMIAVVVVNHLCGAPLPTASQLAGCTGLPATFVVLLLAVGVGEEAGWTAFATPRVLSRHSFLRSWLVLSAIRVLWHLPLMLSGQLPWSLGIAGNIAFQFLMLWTFVRSGRVWFLAAIWHAVLNTVGGEFFFPMVEGNDRARLSLLLAAAYAVLAAIVFFVERRRLEESNH